MKKTRLLEFFHTLTDRLQEWEICKMLESETPRPHWLGMEVCADQIKIWDKEAQTEHVIGLNRKLEFSEREKMRLSFSAYRGDSHQQNPWSTDYEPFSWKSPKK